MFTYCPLQTKLIIFDWDGTLFDSTGVIAYGLQHACVAIGHDEPTIKAAKNVIGLGFNEAIAQLVGEVSPAQYARFMTAYRQFSLKNHDLITLYDGILELLNGLKQQGKWLAVATGKSRAGLNRALADGVLKGVFDATRTADETTSKPHPQMLFELLDEIGVLPSEAIMIGDTSYDIDMANAAKVPSIAVSYGAHDLQTLTNALPSMILSDTYSLAKALGVNQVEAGGVCEQ